MTTSTSPRDLFEFAIARAEHEYGDLTDTWKLLDTKAQATAATAGVFVAAAFAFVRNTPHTLDWSEKALLASAILFLVGCIVFATKSMRIMEISMPPAAADVFDEAKAIWALRSESENLDERFVRLIATVGDDWRAVNSEIREVVNAKADAIDWAQNAILLALGTIVFLICYELFVR